MTTSGVFSLKGLEEYLEKIAQAGQDVDAAAARAVVPGADVILKGMVARAPEETGQLKDTLERGEPQREGNFTFVRVGMPEGADAEVARYGNVQEYGSATTPAHPYIRPTLKEDKAKALRAMRDSLEQDGVI